MHGDRLPTKAPTGDSGGGICHSGAENEIWSYGEEAYSIFKYFIKLREQLKPYIKKLMRGAHLKGTPPMRALFYVFPADEKAWEVDDQFMFGDSLLIAPIFNYDERERNIYLPKDVRWKDYWTGNIYEGGQTIVLDAPIEQIPILINLNDELIIKSIKE